jgi:hypothetical protein
MVSIAFSVQTLRGGDVIFLPVKSHFWAADKWSFPSSIYVDAERPVSLSTIVPRGKTRNQTKNGRNTHRNSRAFSGAPRYYAAVMPFRCLGGH